ncbi:hypothetical protein WMF37_15855 [Sorangium sp. So ce291]|uniref:hypothetical protein n=1 Tax=Sorangium sp. So ce291 TaxID=3133294 RepID=UPI003F630050
MKIKLDPQVTLYVTGHKGEVTELWANNAPLPVGEWTDVASLIDTGGTHHLWGWVYLGSEPGRFEYQIYHERQSFGSNYAFFGWYDPDSTQSNANPSPFPSGVATAGLDGSYVLLRVPPR